VIGVVNGFFEEVQNAVHPPLILLSFVLDLIDRIPHSVPSFISTN
jgi:hypothetical protein